MFDHLMDEVRVINQAYGWFGALDAIKYIFEHKSEYEGTAVAKELRQFMADGYKMFYGDRNAQDSN